MRILMEKDDFYTFGGGFAWEDVFFYQKWRIQRNFITKKCRLLDNWDIRRYEGTFDECRSAFLKYIKIFELSRQRGHMIVMLPGLGKSKNIFKPLWRRALKEKYMAAALNYPSTQKKLGGHIRQLDFFLNHLEDVQEVSFVAEGIGALILRGLISLDSPWKKKIKISRIVEVAPPSHGNPLLLKLSKYKFFNFVLGPMIADMSAKKTEAIPFYPKNIEVGIILIKESFWKKALNFVADVKNAELDPKKEKAFTGAKDVIAMRTWRFNVFKKKKIVDKVIQFLNFGHF